MYARNVAKAANMDMTEFFDAWGFFIPVSFKLYEMCIRDSHSFPVKFGGWGGMSVPQRVVDCFLMMAGRDKIGRAHV